MRREAEGVVLVKREEESDFTFCVVPHSAEADSSYIPPVHTHLSLLQAEHTQLPRHLLVRHVLLLVSHLTASALRVRAASAAVCECHHRAKIWGRGEEAQIKSSVKYW